MEKTLIIVDMQNDFITGPLRPKEAQAVGGAVGRNNISIIVPCHRVIGSDGSLTGYSAGTERKEALLKLEKADMALTL